MLEDDSPNSRSSASRHTFRESIESSPIIAQTASDAIITINEDSRILFVNHAAVKIFGYSTEEMLGAELTMLMPEYLRHVHRAGLKRFLDTGEKHISWDAVELPGLHKSGREISLEISFGEFDAEGHHFFTGIARDISSRKRDEQRLALQHSVTEILAEIPTLDVAIPKLIETIASQLGWQLAAFWKIDTEHNHIQQIATWRDQTFETGGEFQQVSGGLRFARGDGFPGVVWATEKPAWVTDFGTVEFPRSSLAARGSLHSAYGFPIILGKEVLGMIELFSSRIREPDQPTLDALAAIGTQIGHFIERSNNEGTRLAALAQAHTARLEAEALARQVSIVQSVSDAALGHLSVEQVISESLDRIREALSVDTATILLLEAGVGDGNGDGELVAWATQGLEEEVQLGVRIPVGKGFAGRIAAEGRPLIITDLEAADIYNPLLLEKGIKSLLGVPLMARGEPIGVLHVGMLKAAEFTEGDIRLLQLAGDRIALAIENARLFEAEKQARTVAEDANRAKDEFLTILSHELRTPLTPIIGWVHILENRILSESEFPSALAAINRNAYGLKRLINDLLDMSAILSGKMVMEEESVSLTAVLEESIDTMRSFVPDSGVQLSLLISDGAADVTVKGDRQRLTQSFCNILHNAIKFSHEGGLVEVKCEADASSAIVRIKDQGKGIPAEFLPYVFERFRQADGSRTRSHGGLGLGLALVKNFVTAHGGTVEATSEGEGLGSVVIVNLPREIPLKGATGTGLRPLREPNKNAIRILLVEDEPDTLEMLTAHLQAQGFETISCESASAALEASHSNRFDILISDIAMPEMDGLQLISTMRGRNELQSMPAIALTGYASQKDVEAALAAGFDLHLSKPIDPEELTAAIERVIISKQN